MTLKYRILFLLVFILAHTGIVAQTVYQYLKTGDKLYANADYYTAFYYFNKAREADSSYIEATYKLAEASRNINDYKNAYSFYDKVLRVDKYKEFPLSEFWMGITAKYLGNYTIAKNHFQRFKDRYSNNDYYKNKCIQEIAATTWSIANEQPKSTTTVTRMGDEINTTFTEFAATELADSFYQFSSIRESISSVENKNKDFISRIYTMKMDKDKWVENKTLFNWLDQFEENIANGSFSEDGLRFYFNVCENKNISELRCAIYLSEYKDGYWQQPYKLNEDINTKNYTNTQPTEAANKTLYFSSDRPNGVGKLDIWYCERKEDGSFSEVKNMGKQINSIDNEITPSFDTKLNRLYFSSDWHLGYGGYDVFYATKLADTFSTIINAGLPINSSYNDIYFNLNKDNFNKGYLASNRKGALFLKGESCCNDIFKVEIKEDKIKIDSTLITSNIKKDSSRATTIFVTNDTSNNNNNNSTSNIKRLEKLLPVTVYFHNDIPNPRSKSDTTELNYLNTYYDYIQLKKEYIVGYNKTSNPTATADIENLYTNNIEVGYKNLVLFSTILKEALNKNQKVKLTIEGYCSPLALNEYNIHLANRRIASLKNYIQAFDNGFFIPYLKNGHLQIVQAPFGEEKAQAGLSDDRLDTKNSVYNPKAAIERRVAIIAIDLIP
ncbi:MAG: hypothetical protein WCP57_10625 [Bacteroidota bacterium]